MTLSKSGSERLAALETDVREVRDFVVALKGGLRLVVAIQGLILGGIVYTVIQGLR